MYLSLLLQQLLVPWFLPPFFGSARSQVARRDLHRLWLMQGIKNSCFDVVQCSAHYMHRVSVMVLPHLMRCQRVMRSLRDLCSSRRILRMFRLSGVFMPCGSNNLCHTLTIARFKNHPRLFHAKPNRSLFVIFHQDMMRRIVNLERLWSLTFRPKTKPHAQLRSRFLPLRPIVNSLVVLTSFSACFPLHCSVVFFSMYDDFRSKFKESIVESQWRAAVQK